MTVQPVVRDSRLAPLALLGALAGAVAIRVAIAGAAGPRSITAGLVFAGALLAVALPARVRTEVGARVVLLGVAGAVLLVLPVLVTRGVADVHPAGSYVSWAAATSVVATVEEAFLRGALFDALQRWRGADAAVVGAAIAFALLHVPLYGWHAVPLDLAVGLVLGALRVLAGSWVAPAIAHVGADLVGWWTV